MGEFGITHWLVIAGILIVFFGPSRLPKAGRAIGEAIRGFKKGIKGDEIDVTEQSRPVDNLDANRKDPLNQKPKDKNRQDS
jgi:sec-independent protein translocase protein TatA